MKYTFAITPNINELTKEVSDPNVKSNNEEKKLLPVSSHLKFPK